MFSTYLNVDDVDGVHAGISNLEVIGHYSINGDHQYCDDLSELKYYKEPPKNVCFDLDKDRDRSVSKQVTGLKLEFLLEWISRNFDNIKVPESEKSNFHNRWLEPEIVCQRGTLKSLLATPYDNEGWLICAAKFEETIYLCAFDTPEKVLQRLNETEYGKQCSSWGHKFEQYLFADAPNKDPDTSTPLNERKEFNCVFKCTFGNTKLLYGAEMDGVDSKELFKDSLVGKKVEFVEVKTIPNERLNKNGKLLREQRNGTRILKWWSQSYLVGIESIILGCKNRTGLVRKIVKYRLKELEELSENNWKCERCIGFCNAFFDHLRQIVCEDYNKCLYLFNFLPSDRKIQVKALNPTCFQDYEFLEKQFIAKAKEHKKNMQ